MEKNPLHRAHSNKGKPVFTDTAISAILYGNMHITPDSPAHAERIFALQMLFLGLSVLLGLVVIIQFGSPGRRMNADGVYSAAPMYGVPHYPRPISDFLGSSSSRERSERSREYREVTSAPEASVSSTPRIRRSSSASSRKLEDRVRRRMERHQQEAPPEHEEKRTPRKNTRNSDTRFAPGWFWR
ncbi:hypothetical protein A3C37_03730 [Candidatus Peribacteria bacterium RIFCSPHIGHO2_02_FULL_53_20]|nr:MAG: hypothetical protein A3C37_03730 [Candidatus Peribacteria bacterium RIFCSPHIGHO2_02_FULL_53_20]OGJ75060.1 MAG: hypothetical protein A3G69_05480 [Candidatus Peribacteria bacterium RIFCSPLOWO2_12_FULL_53_10]